jgi:DNA-binding LytR/AlgR family response regulator
MITCLIVDDDPSSILMIRLLCEQVAELSIIGECDNSIDAFTLLNNQKVDLVFLDIQMKDMSGIELVKSLGENAPLIIFISSSNQYAAEAFDLNVVDYMVKPVTLPRFLQSTKKLSKAIKCKQESFSIVAQECIFIKDKTALQRININDILFCQASGDYVKLHTANKYFMLNTSLSFFSKKFPKKVFLKVHRSYMAATDKIDRVDDGYVYIKEKKIPYSNSYRAELYDYLKPI